ncbi:GspH/FimT family pseudopilin [Trinickia sp. EG282A]|uniref:GspH/FimT family pseudopilin n=1 Tax=Trinickia sp. EG282A TaxID=3237013 RepID=UPI0034D1F57B
MRSKSRHRIAQGRYARRCAGFTLFELAVAGGIVAVLTTMATPSFVAWRVRDRVDAGVQALLSSLAYARSESVRRGLPVAVCLVDSRSRCIAAPGVHEAVAVDWSAGWAVVADGPAGPIPARRQLPADGIVIRGGATDIRFTPPAGQVIGGFRSFEIAPASVAPVAGGRDRRRCVVIAAGGRARVADGACKENA